jgi:hypothetical protein
MFEPEIVPTWCRVEDRGTQYQILRVTILPETCLRAGSVFDPPPDLTRRSDNLNYFSAFICVRFCSGSKTGDKLAPTAMLSSLAVAYFVTWTKEKFATFGP